MTEKQTNQMNYKESSREKPIKKNRYPFLIEYRSSSTFIFATVFITLLSNVYGFCAFIQEIPLIIKDLIENKIEPKTEFLNQFLKYILLGCHVVGVIGGSLFFGWLEIKVSQRRLAILSGTLFSITSLCLLMVSSRYWVLLLLQVFQGISSSCIWIMSYSLILDHCLYEKLGATIGLFYSIYPLGIMTEIFVNVLLEHIRHNLLLIFAISLCGLSFVMQLLMVEKSKITITWSDKQIDEVVDHNYNSLHLCVEDGQWSKSSSMTTINLRDQPIISEPEPKNIETTLFFLLSQPRLLVSLYQNFIISMVYSAFKATIVYRLIYEWDIVDAVEHLLYISTHMLPYIISLIIGGVLCDRFGTKKVGLMSVTFIVLALVWLGMLDRQYPSWIIIPAMAATGFSMAGIQVSLLMDMMLLVTEQESNDVQKSRGFVRVLALWESMDTLGLFFGSILSALKITTGHFWFYLILSCLCATCAPFMYFYMEFHTNPFNRSLSDMLEAPNSISHSKFPSVYMIKSTVLTL